MSAWNHGSGARYSSPEAKDLTDDVVDFSETSEPVMLGDDPTPAMPPAMPPAPPALPLPAPVVAVVVAAAIVAASGGGDRNAM